MTSTYGWIITKDRIENADVGTIGPRDISDEMMQSLKNGEGDHKFRLYDDDGELYYEGEYIGELTGDGGDPLTDFGMPNAGCTYMKEYINGKWEITIG